MMTAKQLRGILERLPDEIQVTFDGTPSDGKWPLPDFARLARAYWSKDQDILVLGNAWVRDERWGDRSMNFGYLPGPPLWEDR